MEQNALVLSSLATYNTFINEELYKNVFIQMKTSLHLSDIHDQSQINSIQLPLYEENPTGVPGGEPFERLFQLSMRIANQEDSNASIQYTYKSQLQEYVPNL